MTLRRAFLQKVGALVGLAGFAALGVKLKGAGETPRAATSCGGVVRALESKCVVCGSVCGKALDGNANRLTNCAGSVVFYLGEFEAMQTTTGAHMWGAVSVCGSCAPHLSQALADLVQYGEPDGNHVYAYHSHVHSVRARRMEAGRSISDVPYWRRGGANKPVGDWIRRG
jgi:hypothetical protein